MTTLKLICGTFLILCLGSVSIVAKIADDQLFPITDVVPEYPVTAIRDGHEGWVFVQFTVTAAGGVSDVRVDDAEPALIFDEAAIAAAQQFRFEPQIINGTPIDVPDVGYVFRFDLSESVILTAPEGVLSQQPSSQRTPPVELISTEDFIPLTTTAPHYPASANEQGIGGWVIVRFTVTGIGAVDDAEVVDSEPAGVFDAAALEAIREFNYEPRVSEGLAVNVSGVYHMFKFRPVQ